MYVRDERIVVRSALNLENPESRELGAIENRITNISMGESDSTWHVEIEATDQTWIVVNPTSGSGKATIGITVGENYSLEPRYAVVKIISDRNKELVKEIAVTQGGLEFDTTSDSKEFGATNNLEQSVVIGKCYGGWKVSEKPTWIDLLGDGSDGVILLKASENENIEKRNGQVVLESNYISYNTKLRKEITVVQDAMFEVTPSTIIAPSTEYTETIIVGGKGNWEPFVSASWIKVTKKPSGDSFTVSLEANNTTVNRTAVIDVKGGTSLEFVRQVYISQDGISNESGMEN